MLRLSLERQRRGLTQARAAQKVGCGATTFSKVEQSVYVPRKGSPLGNRLERVFSLQLRRLLSEV
jgi:transcriptional regulator with XRE-family HTH domain